MKKPGPAEQIEQLVLESGGNEYDLKVAAAMYRLGGMARAQKYISLLQGAGQRQLPGLKARSKACK